jgi:uncharacterized protein (TIGR03437 family)
VSLSAGKTQQFTATVTGGSGNNSVTWTLSANVGSISNTGLYTAPASVSSQQTVTATATSVADPTKSANASINLLPPLSALISAYSFNEGTGTTVADASGNGLNGTIQNATWTSSGKFGNALLFNGSNALVTIPDSPSLHVITTMTLEAWVKPSKVNNAWRDVIYKGNDNYYLEGMSPNGSAPAVGGTFGSANTNLFSDKALVVNTWAHLAATYDGTTLRLYVNGVQVSSKALTGSLVSSSNPLQIGGDSIYGQYFAGTIDEVRIYSRALSQAEIQTDMNVPVTNSTLLTSSIPSAQLMAAAGARPVQPASAARKMPQPATLVPAQHTLAALSCSPRATIAGGVVTCTLHVTASLEPLQLQLASSTSHVKIPAAVVTRPNQSSLTFQASVDAVAKPQSAIITASLGDMQVQDSLLVMSTDRPVLMTPAKQIAKFGAPVNFTVGVADVSGLPVQLEAKNLPALASFDRENGRFAWTPNTLQKGEHIVSFTATNPSGQSSTAAVNIDVDGGMPVLNKQRLTCSPNAIATVTGKWLSAADSGLSDPSGVSLELGGTQVKINGQAVPVLFRSATQVNFLCPTLNPDTPLSLVVETDTGRTEPIAGRMQENTPRILSLDGKDAGQGMILFPETGELAMQRNYQIPAHPAQPGDRALVWVTGISSSRKLPGAIQIKIGDVPAEVESMQSVAGYAGLDAIYVRIPAGTEFGDAVPVQLEILSSNGRLVRSNSATAAVERARP